jgi:hypothetical protein
MRSRLMDTPIVKPRLLDLGILSLGESRSTSCQLHAPSNAEVMARIVEGADIFRVTQVVSFDLVQGIGPHPRSISDGQRQLAVRQGQLVAIDVTAELPHGAEGVLDGVVEIRGTGWEPVRRPLRVVATPE